MTNPIGLLRVEVGNPAPAFTAIPDSALVSVDFERGNQQSGLKDDLTVGTASIVLKGKDWTQAAKPFLKNQSPIRIRATIPAIPGAVQNHRWSGTPHNSVSEKRVGAALVDRNLMPNPKIRLDPGGYGVLGPLALSFPLDYVRLTAQAAIASGGAAIDRVLDGVGGQTYTYSVDFRSSKRGRITIIYRNAAGTTLGARQSDLVGGTSTTFFRAAITVAALAGTATMQVYLQTGDAMATGDYFDARNFMVNETTSTTYFDGDTAPITAPETPAKTVTVWQGRIGTPVTTYFHDRPPLTVIPATDVFGSASRTKSAGTFVGGSYERRLSFAASVPPGGVIYRRVRIGADDASGTDFSTSRKDVTHLEAFELVRNSRLGWIWAARDDDRAITYRTAAAPPPRAPVLTFSDTYAISGALNYTDIDMTHDGNGFVTAVTLVRLARAATDSDVVLGTWRDTTSAAAAYERLDETIEAYDFTTTVSATEARFWLERQPLPSAIIKSVSISVTDWPAVMENDLIYQPVRVLNAAAGHDATYHVISEKHRADANGWKATYTLRALDGRGSTVTVSQDPTT